MLNRFAQFVVCLAPFCGLSVSLWLLKFHWGNPEGGSSGLGCEFTTALDCNTLLQSGYAYLFGIPVALWGVGAYAVLSITGVWSLYSALAARIFRIVVVAACAASCWFLWLMWFQQAYCLWCASIHTMNLLMALALIRLSRLREPDSKGVLYVRRRALGGFGIVFCVVLGTLGLYHDADSQFSGRAIEDTALTLATEKSHADSQASKRILSSPDQEDQDGAAKTRQIEVFLDFTCDQCAKLWRMLRQIQRDHPDRIQVNVRLFPLEERCNLAVARQDPKHVGACRLARLGHAVRIASPSVSEEFHEQLINSPRPIKFTKGLTIAETLSGQRFPESVLSSSQIDQKISADIDRGIDLGITRLPAFVVHGRVYQGCPDKLESLQEIVLPEED